MTKIPNNQPTWIMVVIVLWYGSMAALTGFGAMIGMSFASEPGGRGSPGFIDYVLIFGPVFATGAFCILSIALWSKERPRAAILSILGSMLFGVLFVSIASSI